MVWYLCKSQPVLMPFLSYVAFCSPVFSKRVTLKSPQTYELIDNTIQEEVTIV